MEPAAGHDQNADQIAYWNGPAGRSWTDRQQLQDSLLAPISEILLDRANVRSGERVVDVGCGCGATTIAFAQRVAPGGHVLGIDISAPMLARARQMAPKGAPVDFVLADATIYPFEPGAFDVMASRFGVMFFAQPELSFANMRRALRPSGRLAFVCWREPRDNPWLMTPLQAVYQHAPRLPQLAPEDPGPFAFASGATFHWMSGSGTVLMRRSKPRWQLDQPAARCRASRRRSLMPPRNRYARYLPRSHGVRRCCWLDRCGL
jgi:ubiquinone/menaquinone biosynthesis C-methylase UbiE